MKRIYKFPNIICIALTGLVVLSGCKKFIAVDPPIVSINEGNVYKNDASAIAVLTGIYINMSLDNGNNLDGIARMTFFPALSADELSIANTTVTDEVLGFYRNNIKSNIISNSFYQKSYQSIYTANAAIVGLTNSTTLTPAVKTQLLGEAYFIRAFIYFNLTSLYGGVPIVTSTDYSETTSLAKSSLNEVYAMIRADLVKAQYMLNQEYQGSTLLASTTERVRPNKAAATALLARIYLYEKDYANAEIQAKIIIDNKVMYDIVPLNAVFLKNSKETIWAIQPVGINADANTGEGKVFIIPSSGFDFLRKYQLNDRLVKAFQPGDQRYKKWTDSVLLQGVYYHYPFKYKIAQLNTPTAEYPVVLRVAEQYLIRAEARILQGNISGGIDDLNILRTRATDLNASSNQQLKQLSSNLSKDDALNAVMYERRVELFTEWGHRWLDLRRTNTIDAVMNVTTPLKGGTWDSRWALYPFPLVQIQNNARLVQNPGYE